MPHQLRCDRDGDQIYLTERVRFWSSVPTKLCVPIRSHAVLFTTLSVFSLCLLLNHLKVQLFPHYLICQLALMSFMNSSLIPLLLTLSLSKTVGLMEEEHCVPEARHPEEEA